MRVQPSIQIKTAGRDDPSGPFCGLKEGDEVTVRLAALEGPAAVLEARGVSVRASLPPGVRLIPGDALALVLTDRQNRRLDFRLVSVNGQNVLPKADHTEQGLLRLGIAPTARNAYIAQLLRQNGPIRPEMIAAFEKIAAKAPGLPALAAAFMAARGRLPSEEESQAFSRPGQLPERTEQAMQNFYYGQLPVRLDGREYTAGLFVFRRHARAGANNEPAVLLIALQTQNMGVVEARIGRDAGGLLIDFYLSSGAVRDHFLDSLDALKESMAGAGLRLLGVRASADGEDPGSPDTARNGGIDIRV